MDFLIGANPRVVFAFWLGVAVVVIAGLMLATILVMRHVVSQRERNRERSSTQWRPILFDASEGRAMRIPDLPARDVPGFIDAWNSVHHSLGDRANPDLQRLAHYVGLEKHLDLVIDHGSFHDRVIAILALGYLRSRTNFDRLARYLDDRSTIISISAAQALMHVDPARAVTMLVPHIVSRQDWPQDGVAKILHDTAPELVSRELGVVALQATADVAPRLIRFLAGVSPQEAAPVIRRILDQHPDDHLVSTCLQVMTDPEDLDQVRPLLHHERWHVRMHAASTLGRIGRADDETLLRPLLADGQWWVRYRAAQAISRLPDMDPEGMQRVRAAQTDRFARDVLDQVIAERHMEVDE